MHLHERLVAWREYKGLLQKTVAERTGISPAGLSKIETGQVNPAYATLEKLVTRGLELSLARFYGRVPKRKTAA
jgi:transcriptional regulator with XRE-family HTH domain